VALAANRKIQASTHEVVADDRLPTYYFVVGMILVTVVLPILGDLPSVTALSFSGAYIVIWAVCLGQWRIRALQGSLAWWKILIWAVLLPLVSVVLTENLVRSVMAILMIVSFMISSFKSRAWMLPIGLVVFYAGLSLGVGYLSTRDELRDFTRVATSSPVEKAERVLTRLGATQLFDPNNDEHLEMIDARMNQSILVGAAEAQLSSNMASYAYGETIWFAVLALVPRALWPDKPVSAGSMNLATVYTGIEFAEGTSVGLGPIMEFYINFGIIGVFLGMMVIGTALRYIDAICAIHLHNGDWMRAAAPFVAGIGMIQVEGSFVEVTATCAAGYLMTLAANRFYHSLPRISLKDTSVQTETRGLGARHSR
jgi:hypothetical protein